ncbi:hypothetical protein [Sphingopyxis granuli]|uniref:hypothetical protein n=1 Tax=Sphingopyxis granuli TaxID=267128 RepID=UPI001BAE93BB|nr:hypothetical protein [Sphingopyxis granuli]QUM71323.1 hypothetical protein ICN83_13300 [Sphingopyxis granuli]
MKILQQQLVRHSPFAGLMGGGAILGIARSLTLAILLSAADFGLYSIAVAVVMFFAPLPGLGLIEETRKQFPRFHAGGDGNEIVPRSDRIARLAAGRTAAIGTIAALAAILVGKPTLALLVVPLTMLSFGNAWASILASALRAGGTTMPLAVTAFIRALLTFPLTVGAAYQFGLEGALWGEACGAALGCLAMRIALARLHPGPAAAIARFSGRASRAGMLVFAGGLLVSAPFYLNRPVAALTMSPAEVGTLSLILVLVGALQTTTGIADQVTGPRLVHWQHQGMEMVRQKRRFFAIAAALALVSLTAFLAMGIGLHLPWIAPLVEKYGLSSALLLPAAILAALNITSTADWMLQAHDREPVITFAAACNLAVFGVLSFLVVGGIVELQSYIWGLAAAKLCQLSVQFFVIGRLSDR